LTPLPPALERPAETATAIASMLSATAVKNNSQILITTDFDGLNCGGDKAA